MVLFPIAFVWIVGVLVWLVLKGAAEEPQEPGQEPLRFRPRIPRRPWSGAGASGSRSRARTAAGASRRRG